MFAQQLQQFDKVRARKAFVTEYQREPMFEKGLEPFDEARAVVKELIDEYRAAEKPEYVVRLSRGWPTMHGTILLMMDTPNSTGLWCACHQRGAGPPTATIGQNSCGMFLTFFSFFVFLAESTSPPVFLTNFFLACTVSMNFCAGAWIARGGGGQAGGINSGELIART